MHNDDITQVIFRFANSFDLKDWATLETTLDDKIVCDYTDLRGTVETLRAADYIQKRIEALGSLCTQHLFSNAVVVFKAQHAVCYVNAVIFRRSHNKHFNTHAFYTFQLRLKDESWRIAAIKQQVLWNDGDASIHSGVKKNLTKKS